MNNTKMAKLKQKWAQLMDDDLQDPEGIQEEFLGRIFKRTRESREAVEKALKESCSTGISQSGAGAGGPPGKAPRAAQTTQGGVHPGWRFAKFSAARRARMNLD